MKKSGPAVPLSEQKGFAEELERRVAQRTADLTAANERLRTELADCEREQSHEALRNALDEIQNSESKLRQVIDAIPALAWSAHPDGSGEFFNKHYLDYVGLPAEYVTGWGWIAALHPDDVESLSLTWQQIRESEQFGEGEVRLRRHDGEYRWFLFRVNPVRNESGRVIKWYGTNIDITERKLALEGLQANQDLLHLAQKSARAMAFDWYIQKEINYWSPEQEALYGLSPGAFDGTFASWKSMVYAERLAQRYRRSQARAADRGSVDRVSRCVAGRKSSLAFDDWSHVL